MYDTKTKNTLFLLINVLLESLDVLQQPFFILYTL